MAVNAISYYCSLFARTLDEPVSPRKWQTASVSGVFLL